MSRHSRLAVSLVALASTVLLAPSPATASTQGDQPGETVESSATALGGTTEVTNTVLDAAGRVVSTTTETVRNPAFRAAAPRVSPASQKATGPGSAPTSGEKRSTGVRTTSPRRSSSRIPCQTHDG